MVLTHCVDAPLRPTPDRGGTNYGYDILGRVTSINNRDGSGSLIGYGGASAPVNDERGTSTSDAYRS